MSVAYIPSTPKAMNEFYALFIKIMETMKKQKNDKVFTIQQSDVTDWKQYLNDLHEYLTALGFRKFKHGPKNEDFAYWKTYNEKYQIGLFVYDFTKYDFINGVGIQFECMPIDIDYRCDLSVSKDIELPEFEKMAERFYNAMIKYYQQLYE